VPTRPYDSLHWRQLRHAIYERDGGRCRLCGERVKPTAFDVDHIVSWRQGGAWYDPANLRLTCRVCNRGRHGNQTPRPQAERPPVVYPGPSRDW